MNETAIANQRFTMIADILPVIDDEKARGKAITRIATEYGVSKPTITAWAFILITKGFPFVILS